VEQVKNYARYDFDDILRLLDLNEKNNKELGANMNTKLCHDS